MPDSGEDRRKWRPVSNPRKSAYPVLERRPNQRSALAKCVSCGSLVEEWAMPLDVRVAALCDACQRANMTMPSPALSTPDPSDAMRRADALLDALVPLDATPKSELERLDFSGFMRDKALEMLELGRQRLEAKRAAGTITDEELGELIRTPALMREVRGEIEGVDPDEVADGTISFCMECDAPPGGCEHTGRRYLPPIKYAQVHGSSPKDWIWRAPDHERQRLDNPQSSWPQAAPRRREVEVQPIQHLVVKLEAWFELDARFEEELRAEYERDPQYVSRIALACCEKAEHGELRSPAGWLRARLRKHR